MSRIAPADICVIVYLLNIGIILGYGMTECLSIYRIVVPEDDTREIIRGKIQLGVEVKV